MGVYSHLFTKIDTRAADAIEAEMPAPHRAEQDFLDPFAARAP
jgi:hypothetical protein